MDFQSALDHRRTLDTLLLQRLVQAGANPALAHELEHSFFAPDAARAQPLLEWGEEHGFLVTMPVSHRGEDGESIVGFQLIKASPLDLARVSKDTHALVRLALQHDIEYDGWGCQVRS